MNKSIFTKDHKYTVEQLKKARIEAKLDQKQVARLLDRSQSYVSKIESGQRRIDVVQLKELGNIYQKPIVYFIR